ncbi:fasciclin domain-containing protein [Hyphomonas sp.]|uniref:fasciclin domain-containing protein n=1 Tax=Hyphomonas sp. TaxID=87 RepID=UPI003F6F19A5
MKRILIIPATAALLTGLSATAQDFNENPDTVNTPAQVLYTGDEANLDEMTIEQLNALQLQRLQTAGDETAASGESTFQVAEADTTDAGAEIESDSNVATEMGGPDYASKTDAMADADMPGTIAEVAMDDARFSTLVTLLKQADLADALSNDGPFTVFAPTNEAFARLDPELVARLTSDDGSDDLANLLKRHVVEGNYKAADITQGETELMTLAGTNLAIERAGDMITADHVDVVSGDIKASNGVIHAIDMVIVPMIETEADVEANTDLETGIDPLGQ